MRSAVFICLLAIVLSSCALSAHPTEPWPSDNSAPAIPGALGVNIHFTDPEPGELAMLAAAGFRWVRMDFVWQSTETGKGTYDFSAYDRFAKRATNIDCDRSSFLTIRIHFTTVTTHHSQTKAGTPLQAGRRRR